MLRALVEYVIAAVEFFEAEARSLRRGIMRLGIGLMLLCVVGVLAVGGVSLLAAGLYLLLATYLPPAAAAAIDGAAVLILAWVLLSRAKTLAS